MRKFISSEITLIVVKNKIEVVKIIEICTNLQSIIILRTKGLFKHLNHQLFFIINGKTFKIKSFPHF